MLVNQKPEAIWRKVAHAQSERAKKSLDKDKFQRLLPFFARLLCVLAALRASFAVDAPDSICAAGTRG
jgi:hypothetical protein